AATGAGNRLHLDARAARTGRRHADDAELDPAARGRAGGDAALGVTIRCARIRGGGRPGARRRRRRRRAGRTAATDADVADAAGAVAGRAAGAGGARRARAGARPAARARATTAATTVARARRA